MLSKAMVAEQRIVVRRSGKILTVAAWAFAVTVLVVSGVWYRVLARRLKLVAATPIALPVSLSYYPMEIDNWVGRDVPVSRNIQRVAGNDDYLNRLYINKLSDEWADVYVGYSARPRTMLGHRPEVCYVAGGWIHDGSQDAYFVCPSGRRVPCRIHRFHISTPQREVRVVLNFYIVNGRVTTDESVFSGIGWRTPNIAGDPARYVAQVQIGSALENSTLIAATSLTDEILDFFPDETGRVRAAESVRTDEKIVK